MAEVRIEPWHRLLVVESDSGPAKRNVELSAEVGALSLDTRPFQALVLAGGAEGDALANRLLELGAQRVAVVGGGLTASATAQLATFADEGSARAWLKAAAR